MFLNYHKLIPLKHIDVTIIALNGVLFTIQSYRK